MLKLANTELILINPSPSNVNDAATRDALITQCQINGISSLIYTISIELEYHWSFFPENYRNPAVAGSQQVSGSYCIKGPHGIYESILTTILKNCRLQEHKNNNTH